MIKLTVFVCSPTAWVGWWWRRGGEVTWWRRRYREVTADRAQHRDLQRWASVQRGAGENAAPQHRPPRRQVSLYQVGHHQWGMFSYQSAVQYKVRKGHSHILHYSTKWGKAPTYYITVQSEERSPPRTTLQYYISTSCGLYTMMHSTVYFSCSQNN